MCKYTNHNDACTGVQSVDELHRNWKSKYLATRSDGSKYVKFNLAGYSWPSNAVTTSEAIG